MANEIAQQPKSLKTLLAADITKEKFKEVLGKKSPAFIASLLSVVNNNDLLAKAEPKSVLSAAMTAATLDLPINQNLGFAYIIPYYDSKSKQYVAQFQMGYKGFVQLAQRSGMFQTINVTDVKEGEIEDIDRLTGEIKFSWKKEGREALKIIGFIAYFKLLNGFEKPFYMTVEELKAHGIRYSQSAKKGYGLWEDNFEAMASKTVVKLLLSKYAPLTTEMQTAQLADQAIITDGGYEYVDNKPATPEEVAAAKERDRIKKHIEEAKTLEELKKCEQYVDPEDNELTSLYAGKERDLSESKEKGKNGPDKV